MTQRSRRLEHRACVTAMLSITLTTGALANVVGTDFQNFNATTNGIDYITVQSAETLAPGYLNLGLVFNYAVNSLPVYEEEGTTQNRFRPNDTLSTAEALLGIGLTERLELGATVGRLLSQTVASGDVDHGEFGPPGWTHFRLGAKYRLLRAGPVGVATAASATFNYIERNPYLGQGNSPIYHGELIGDMTLGPVHVAANAGYRWRRAGKQLPESSISPTRDQLIGSLAGSTLLPGTDTKIIAELFGSRRAGGGSSSDSSRQEASAEALLGLKYDHTSHVSVVGGAASELIHGVSSPDWRLFAGLHWTVGPTFGQRDNIRREEIEPKRIQLTVLSIPFSFASANLDPTAKSVVAELAAKIRAEGTLSRIVVEGHTDSVGAADYNLDLSRRRAEAVRKALIDEHGFDAAKIEAVGYGETQPIADNGNFQGRERNRRVAVRLTK